MQSDDYVYDDFEPVWQDLEEQVARNQAYGIDLEHAYAALRAQSLYWYAAALFCLVVVVSLGFVAFAPYRIEAGLLQTYTGQTIVTTMFAVALSAAVGCFSHFTALRSLASEASRVSRANQHMITDARAFLEEIS